MAKTPALHEEGGPMMTTYNVSGVFTVTDMDRNQLEVAAGKLMEQLLALEDAGCGIHSSAVSADLGASRVAVEVSIDAESEKVALSVAQSCMRAAIHAAGGATSDWEKAPTRVNAALVTV
jgi:hypothetical protein